jgi:LmeA-like phospholipid-binding
MKRLVIGLLVLAVVLVAADFGAAAVAESMVSRQMRSQLNLADDPSVRINGFPFLPQALAGHYQSMDVEAQRISAGTLDELSVRAQLRNVTAPLPMLLGTGPKTIGVQVAEGTIRIPAKAVEKLVPEVQKLRVEPVNDFVVQQAVDDGADPALEDIDPDRAVRLVATSPLIEDGTEVGVIAAMELADGRVRLAPRDIRLSGSSEQIAPQVEQVLRRAFTLTLDPGRLPLQVTPTKVRAIDDALEVSGRARDLSLGAAASGG